MTGLGGRLCSPAYLPVTRSMSRSGTSSGTSSVLKYVTCRGGRPPLAMMGTLVVRPPQPRQSRNGDDRDRSRAQHTLQLGHSASVIGNMLEDVERGHYVERRVRERHLGRRGGDCRKPPPLADLTRLVAGVAADDIRILKRVPECRQIRPSAATHVEHETTNAPPRRDPSRRGNQDPRYSGRSSAAGRQVSRKRLSTTAPNPLTLATV